MNTTNASTKHFTNPSENTVQNPESIEFYIEDLFNEEGAFGEADCAGI